MPDSNPAAPRPAPRSDAERGEEHRAIERLADGLMPALIARLTATGLAELEVRDGPWKVRLRRSLELVGTGRRAADRQFRVPVAGGSGPHAAGGQPGTAHAPTGGARSHESGRPSAAQDAPMATSPAVGIFRPRAGIAGTRVRAGDRLGAVEMLGIPQEVLAPVDGLVGRLMAETGEGVEYGQPLIEMRTAPAPAAPAPAAPGEQP